MKYAVAALLAYLLGTIPFGLILTRLAGLGDIRAIGSGNIGATNVLRTGRKGLAAATLLLDALKAVAAVILARALFGGFAAQVAAIGVVVGHAFPVWLRFRGGKGVASGLGAVLALYWPVGIAAALAWIVAVAITRISSVGAITACIAAPVVSYIVAPNTFITLAVLMIALIILLRHDANITRLIAGREPRIGRR